MGPRAKVRFRSEEFTRTLRRYREFSRRDPATITNTKGFYVSRGAVRETMRTPREKILGFLQAVGEGGAPIAALIVNLRQKAKGEPGLYGKAMAKAIQAVKAARLKSRAFLASGWLDSIKKLEPLAEKKRGAPRADRAVKRVGQAKGYATPARPDGWVAKTTIVNTAQTRWDKGKGAREGLAGLQKAFSAEVQSMKEYIEKKMRETAAKAGVKHR